MIAVATRTENVDLLRELLAAAVEEFNAASDSGERLHAWREIATLRQRIERIEGEVRCG